MLKNLHIKDVGPASEMTLDLGERINVITGDNGLGKSFLLDAIWYALTRTWANQPIWKEKMSESASIKYQFQSETFEEYGINLAAVARSPFPPFLDFPRNNLTNSLVIYAQVDGNFSVWDPIRNQAIPRSKVVPLLPGPIPHEIISPARPPYIFSSKEVWEGLPLDKSEKLCVGLVQDWQFWERNEDSRFEIFKNLLGLLSSHHTEQIRPGKKTKRLSPYDTREFPTLIMPYEEEIPIVFASAAIKRILSLAYLIVWSWSEYKILCEQIGLPDPVKDIIFLIDEPETHLHPQWQRRILPSILKVAEILEAEQQLNTQLIATTHSPIILSSCESIVDNEKDRLYHLELVGKDVILKKEEWRVQGDIDSWLTSDIFGLDEPGSIEREEAMKQAMAILEQPDKPSIQELEQIEESLQKVLNEFDPFWPRWQFYREKILGQ